VEQRRVPPHPPGVRFGTADDRPPTAEGHSTQGRWSVVSGRSSVPGRWRMRLPGVRRARGVALVLILATLGVLGCFAYRRVVSLYRNIGPILVDQLEKQLGREVHVGSVDASHPGRVVLGDVAVASGARIAQGTLFRAPRVVVYFRM